MVRPENKINLKQVEEKLKNQNLLLELANNNDLDLLFLDKMTSKSNEVLENKDSSLFGFFAQKGVSHNGHDFLIPDLLSKVRFVVIDDPAYFEKCKLFTPTFLVSNSRAAWAVISALFWGEPQKSLHIVGITGTNGKSTTAWISRELFMSHGVECLLIGTLGIYWGKEKASTTHTSLDAFELMKWLAFAKAKKIKTVVMEVSSHALVQSRVYGLEFAAVGFTSFSQDHLDFHSNMEEYLKAKLNLFEHHIGSSSLVIINSRVMRLLPQDLITKLAKHSLWTIQEGENLSGNIGNTTGVVLKEQSLEFGSRLLIYENEKPIYDLLIPFIGPFNISNFLTALLCVKSFGEFSKLCFQDFIKKSFPQNDASFINQVPGRLQRIKSNQKGPLFIVDYSHTPDALEKVLHFISTIKKQSQKLWVVFGCGGDRDRAKRPIMGEIAAKHADFVVLTSDNPRSEEPDEILAEINVGYQRCSNKRATGIEVISDRFQAIAYAKRHADLEDIILVAGKGHEDTQEFKNKEKIEFNDVHVISELLENKK